MSDEDAELMVAFGAGDATAFDALFRRWSPRLLRYLERMVRDRALAEELLQEAFLRVHRARDRYRADARFSTWLYTIATNLVRNEMRRPARRSPHLSTDAEDGVRLELVGERPDPERRIDSRRTGARVEKALGALPERQRAALWLTAVEGHSYAEVARALETTEKSVKSLVHRARSAVSGAMQEAETAGSDV